MIWEGKLSWREILLGIQDRNMRPNMLSNIYIYKSSMITLLFVNATIGFSENLFLVFLGEAVWVYI